MNQMQYVAFKVLCISMQCPMTNPIKTKESFDSQKNIERREHGEREIGDPLSLSLSLSLRYLFSPTTNTTTTTSSRREKKKRFTLLGWGAPGWNDELEELGLEGRRDGEKISPPFCPLDAILRKERERHYPQTAHA